MSRFTGTTADAEGADLQKRGRRYIFSRRRIIMEMLMSRRYFTATEAAALTQLPLKAVNNAIDKQFVPAADGRGTDAGRRLRVSGLLALTLERELSAYLFPAMRKR